MSTDWSLYAFFLIFFSIGGVGLYFLSKQADKLYKHLDAFQDRADRATTIEELTQIAEELCIYANKNCCHRHHGTYARKVLSYIQGKRAGLLVEKK